MINERQPGALILELQRATHATLQALAARLADLGLNASEINILANLADGLPRSIGQLATDTGTKPTTLTSVLDRLVRKGHVTRELDLSDRRSFRVSLTADGRRVAAASLAAMHDVEHAALGMVSTADLAGFRAVASAMTQIAG